MQIKNDYNNTQKEEKMSYCGVNVHFQNGIAEKRIRDLQEHARKN